jgi:hypothetical protein
MWCEANRRDDLLKSYPRNLLLKEIRKIDAYSWLHEVKPHGNARRYPGIRPHTKDDARKEALEAATPVPQAELKQAVGYRRF